MTPAEPCPDAAPKADTEAAPHGDPDADLEVHRALGDRLADLTLTLCRIPSVTGDEAAMADAVEGRLRRLAGWEVARHGPTVLARSGPTERSAPEPEPEPEPRTEAQRHRVGPTGERPSSMGPLEEEGRRAVDRPLIVLYGHTDTVPPKANDPLPRRDGDRVVGLGASDMKGGLAVMLALAESFAPERSPVSLGLVFYDREEGPWMDSGLGPVLEVTPWLHEAALSICLEPSDNVVQVGCLGSLHATVRFAGRAAHSARPWQGHNAIHAAAPLLARLAARAPVEVDCGGFTFREVISATVASGGIGRNVIPDRFELNLNYRFAPGRSVAEAQADVLALVAGEAEVLFTDLAPSGRVVTDNPWLRTLLRESGAALAPKQAWTDVARLSAAGIDAVNFGPGLAAQAHQAGEHASVAKLVEGYAMLGRFLGGRARVSAPPR